MDASNNPMVKELEAELVLLAHAADQILGQGKIVDAYFGPPLEEFDPSWGWDPRDASDIARNLERLADRADLESPSPPLVDLIDNARAIASRLEPGRLPSELGAQIRVLLGVSLDDAPASINRRQKRLADRLASAGYSERWPKALQRWRADREVDHKTYLGLLEDQTAKLRHLTYERILPQVLPNEGPRRLASEVRFRSVESDESWTAYHSYEGNYKSLVEINARTTFIQDDAVIFASHEVFPGHHLDSAVKEYLFEMRELGPSSVMSLIGTPSALVAEGLAESALDLVGYPLSANEEIALEHDRLISEARHDLALDVQRGEVTTEEAVEKLCELAGLERNRAQQALEFAHEWRYHFPTYVLGRRALAKEVRRFGKRVLLGSIYRSQSIRGLDMALSPS